MVESGYIIIGFDFCEIVGYFYEWDVNVGVCVLYKFVNFMGKS